MRSVALPLAVWLAFPAPLAATCVVAFKTNSHIIFAADSAETVTNRAAVVSVRPTCKIRRAGKFWILNGGLSQAGHIDVLDESVRAVSQASKTSDRSVKGSMAAALAALERTYHAHIEPELAPRRFSAGFDVLFAPGQPIIQIRVGGVDAGRLVIGAFVVDLVSREPFRVATRVATCPGDVCDPDGRLLDASAASDTPAVALVSHQPYPSWLDKADASAARRLLTLQAASTPERVAAPFDVLEITATSARWIGRDPRSACAAIR